MKKLRKFLTLSVMVMSIAVMSGFASLSPANASAQAGDLIKMDGLSSVYYLGADGKRYVFPSESVYFSWYSDFSGVVTIPASELQTYPLGSNVTMRAGTKLVKITTDPSVYAVSADGTLRKIQSEADAIALYGSSWASMVVDVADAFFTNYTIGAVLPTGTYPAGTLLKNANNASVYYFDGTDYRMIGSDAAFAANRFQYSNIVTTTMTLTASGTAISGMEDFSAPSGTAGGVASIITGSGLTVALSSSTPASMNIPGNSSVDFLKFNLTAASDGAINVNSIKLTAYGLSDGQNIDDVTFYDNGVKVGTSKNINSDRIATFNFSSPVYVTAGMTKTLTVKATVATTTGSYGLGIAAASDILSSGASVTGSFPIVGNTMSAVAGSLGTVTITDTDVSNSVSFGEDDVLLADFTLDTGSEEDILLQSLALYNGGTNTEGIVSNLKLIVDGEEVATGVYADRYVTFSNINNYVIEKSKNVSVEVRGDMGVTNNSDTVELYLKDKLDLIAIGQTHGFNVTLTNYFDAVDTIITLNTGDFTIDMDKSATPAQDVKPDTTDVVLATLSFTSNGENATITDIAGSSFYVAHNTSATSTLIENAELYEVSTGSIYDLEITDILSKNQLTLSDEIALTKGVTKTFQVRADVLSGVSENTTLQVVLNKAGMTIEGDVSGANITDVTPSSVSGSIITVKEASLTLTPTSLTAVSVVGGSTDTVVYQARVKAGNADAVKITSFKLTASTTATTAFTNSNVSKLSLWLNGKLLKNVSNQINETAGTITFSSLDSSNYTVAAGAEVDLVVKADLASTVTAGNFKLSIDDDAHMAVRSVDGNNTVTPDTTSTDSRVVTTVQNGSLVVALVTTDAKANRNSMLLAGSQTETDRYLGEITFKTANEAVKVKTLTLTNSATSTSADLTEVKLVNEAGTVVKTQAVDANGDVTFDPFDVVFDADETTSLFIVAVAKGVNVNNDPTSTATVGNTVQYALSTTTAIGNESGATITPTNSAGTSMTATIVGSKLNSVVNAMTDGQLTAGLGKTIGKYTFVFDNGSNRNTADNTELKAVLTDLVLTVSKSATTTLADVKVQIEGTSNKSVAGDITNGTTSSATVTFDSGDLDDMTDGAKLDGSVTLVVTANVTTTTDDGEYVQTSIAATETDIDYKSNTVQAGTMQLPVTEVVGGTLSE